MGDRPPGTRYHFQLTADGAPVVAILGYLIEDPDCYESFNIHALMWREPAVFADQPALPAGSRPPAAAVWFPSLALVQPGYQADVVGPGSEDPELVAELLAAVRQWGLRRGLAAVAVLYPGSPALVEALSMSGCWSQVAGTVRSRLHLAAGGFERYPHNLPRSHMKQVRKDLRLLEANGFHTEAAPSDDVGDAEVRLRTSLTERYGSYSSFEVERTRLDRLLQCYPRRAVQLYRCRDRTGRMVAFSIFLESGDEWHSFWYGCDYQAAGGRRVYFDAMFYAPIRIATARGVRVIDYGLGYEESKIFRGCTLEPRDVWITTSQLLTGRIGRVRGQSAASAGSAVIDSGSDQT